MRLITEAAIFNAAARPDAVEHLTLPPPQLQYYSQLQQLFRKTSVHTRTCVRAAPRLSQQS
jgi:hypothetical protein